MSFVVWPWQSRTRLQIRLAAMVLLAMLSLTVVDASGTWNARHDTIAAASAETTNLARSLADDVDGDFTIMDTILVGLRERVVRDGTGRAALERLRTVLMTRSAALPMIHSILILDAAGRLLVSGDGAWTPGMSMAKSATFQHHRDSTSLDMFVGPPIRSIVDGRWVVKISRRVEYNDGSFAGVVVACIATDFFQHLFSSFDVGQRGVIMMMRREGIGLARSPPLADFAGGDISKTGLFGAILKAGQQADFEATSPIDGTIRLNSVHQVGGTPILISVGRDKDEVLAAWRHTALLHVLGLCFVLAVIYDLGRRLALRVGDNERSRDLLEEAVAGLTASEAQLTTANQRLEMAEQIAQVGHWQVDLSNGNAVTWSDQVYRIHGRDPATFAPSLETGINAYHPDDRATVEAALGKTMAMGEEFQIDARLVRYDGVIRNVKSRGSMQNDWLGNPATVFGVFMDVTEQKQAEHLLLQARKDAEAANKALAVANCALEALAMQDALTGLANRRHFDKVLDAHTREARKTGGSLALILIDVDRFKQFNDLYGHPAGDACLRMIAQAIAAFANRAGDIACRYGGEEMALLLPRCTEAAALAVAEDVVQAIRNLTIRHSGSERDVVTISAGVGVLSSDQPMNRASDLVAWADEGLYAAKRGGRDCVRAYSSIGPIPIDQSQDLEVCQTQVAVAA